MSPAKPRPEVVISIRQHLYASIAVTVVLFGGVLTWAAATELSGAVVANGKFVVDGHVKKIQHPTGGVIAEILAVEGTSVSKGDVLIRLDETQPKAQLAIITKRLTELRVRQFRLEAERDDHETIAFDLPQIGHSESEEVEAAIISESRLFNFRREAREGKKAQLLERIMQYEHEIEGFKAQQKAYERGLVVLEEEITALRPLLVNGFVNAQRLNALETQAATFGGERGEKIAFQAQTAGRIAETRLQILSIDQELRTEVGQELREIQGQLGEFEEREIAATDELRRIDIVAPQSGIVHQLTTHTIGGVISPAETVLQIVPDDDQLTIEVQVPPQDIDQITMEQTAIIRLTAFNQRTTPELNGTVQRIAAELSTDEKTGLSWYLIRIGINAGELNRTGPVKIVPGMPAEALIQTKSRSALSYLIKPLADQIKLAFREE